VDGDYILLRCDDLLSVNLLTDVWVELRPLPAELSKKKYEINDEARTGYNEASLGNHRTRVNVQLTLVL
jgi:hypothetical protein